MAKYKQSCDLAVGCALTESTNIFYASYSLKKGLIEGHMETN